MCVKVSGEEKMCGKEEGRARGRCRQIHGFSAGVRTWAVFTSMCWSGSEREWFLQLVEEGRSEAGPAESTIPGPPPCLVSPGCRGGSWAVAFLPWHCSFAGISGRKPPSSKRKVFLSNFVIWFFQEKMLCPVFPFPLLSERGMLLGLSLWGQEWGSGERVAERGLSVTWAGPEAGWEGSCPESRSVWAVMKEEWG